MQPSNTELILIRVTGEDRPGLTASVTEILAKYDATILDIGQADIHNTLSLGILFRSEERHSGFIMKELLFKASSLGVTIRFEPIGTDQYENWVGMQGKNRYILTVLGRKLSARQILQSPNQKIPDRKTKCVIKTHINIKQNVIFGAKLKPV